MKHYRIDIPVTFNEALALLWSIEGRSGYSPNKGTIAKIKRKVNAIRRIDDKYERAAHLQRKASAAAKKNLEKGG